MFDIDFFEKAEVIKKKIVSGKIKIDKQKIFDEFEKLRSKKPFVFSSISNPCPPWHKYTISPEDAISSAIICCFSLFV